uniref:Uncharacterized protein n=1 Tax=Globodera pallida TaxID=36090 RepID=A0A183CIB7_GLOPA
MRSKIPALNEFIPQLISSLFILAGVVSGGQPISGLPDDGGFDMPERSDGTKVGHLRHAFNILEPEFAQSVWGKEGMKNPIRRTTTIPLNDRLDIGNTGELQQKEAAKPLKRMPRTAVAVASDLDDSPDGKKNAKEVEVPAKEFEWEEEEKRKRDGEESFPPKEWWDLEEPEASSSTSATTTTTKRHALKGSKLFEVDGAERTSAEERSLVFGNSRKRESGRARRGTGRWSGEEAIERQEVKFWPKLVPSSSSSSSSNLRPNYLSVPTTSSPPTTTKRTTTNPYENKRIAGGNGAIFASDSKKGPAKKEQIFRDLPAAVEVVSSLVEKTVDNRKQHNNSPQRQKSVEESEKAINGRTWPTKQNRPAFPHILDRDSPGPTTSRRVSFPSNGTLATTVGHSAQQSPPQSSDSQKQKENDRLFDSLPTIVIGEPEKQTDHLLSTQSNQSTTEGTQNAGHNAAEKQQNAKQNGQTEVAPADQFLQLPPGFSYLATVNSLPENGRLLIGNRTYVIEKTLNQRHLFPRAKVPPPVHQPQQQRRRVSNDGEFSALLPQLIDYPSPKTTTILTTTNGSDEQQQQQGQRATPINNTTAPGESARRYAPRKKMFADAPQGTFADVPEQIGAVGVANPTNRRLNSKKDLLAHNLGLALSQIFGNFSVGHLPDTPEKKQQQPENEQQQQQQQQQQMKPLTPNGEENVEKVVSEPHRLTRVFEKKRP